MKNKVHPTLRAYASSSESSEADDEPFIDPPLPSNCSEGAMSACKVEYSVVNVFSPADGSGGNRAAVVQTQEGLEIEAMARIARCASSHALPPPSSSLPHCPCQDPAGRLLTAEGTRLGLKSMN